MMLAKAVLKKVACISLTERTVVVFKNNFQFTLVPNVQDDGSYVFHFVDIQGDFEITKIAQPHNNYYDDYYHKDSNTMRFTPNGYSRFRFTISANAEFKKVNLVEVEYHLQFPTRLIQLLNYFECYCFFIKLPGYEHLKFDCHIRKYKDSEVILVVENPYNFRINGKEGNFECTVSHPYTVDRTLSFIFDPSTVTQSPQMPFEAESRPDSALLPLTNFEKQFSTKLSLSDILLDSKYADVIFISSDKKRFPTNKSIIIKHTKMFPDLFNTASSKPLEFNVAANGETLAAVLDFCHGKSGSFKKSENLMFQILQFAKEYGFEEIMEACCTYFEQAVNVQNVCEIIQMAYLYKLESLKQKCKEIMNENKAEINPEKFKQLSNDILFDVFCR